MADVIGNMINENPALFIGIMAGVTILFLVIMIVAGAKRKARKKKMMADNPNLIEIEFDEIVGPPNPIGMDMSNSGYTLYTVNGQQPQIFGRSVLVPAGEVVLDCEYFILPVGNHFANSFGRRSHSLTVSPGRKYTVTYNVIENSIELK